MHARQATAIGVDRQSTAGCDGAARYQRAGCPFLAETQVLEKQQNIDRECVIKLKYIDIARRKLCHREGPWTGLRRCRHRQIRHLTDLPVRLRTGASEQIDRGTVAVARALGARNDNCPRSVSDQAAIQDVQWITDHATRHDIGEGERIAREGYGVTLRPLARGYGDRSELLACGPI